jgi:A/G-specific adenine glycosylase
VGSRQSAFAGSDRQGRGRLVDALRAGPVGLDGLAGAMGWPDDPARARRVAADVVAAGLAVERDAALHLP